MAVSQVITLRNPQKARKMIVIYLTTMVAVTLLIGIGLSKFIELK